MNSLLLRGAFAAIGFWIATYFVGGLHFEDASTLVVAGLTLGLMNAFVRPVLILLTLPLTVLSLGFFLLVINADRKSTRLNSSHIPLSRMPSSA